MSCDTRYVSIIYVYIFGNMISFRTWDLIYVKNFIGNLVVGSTNLTHTLSHNLIFEVTVRYSQKLVIF